MGLNWGHILGDVAGAVLGYFTGGLSYAALGAGLAEYAQSGSLKNGLQTGLAVYGVGGLYEGLAGAAAGTSVGGSAAGTTTAGTAAGTAAGTTAAGATMSGMSAAPAAAYSAPGSFAGYSAAPSAFEAGGAYSSLGAAAGAAPIAEHSLGAGGQWMPGTSATAQSASPSTLEAARNLYGTYQATPMANFLPMGEALPSSLGGMTMGSAGNIYSGVSALEQAQRMRQQMAAYAAAADPQAAYRAQYAKRLAALQANPNLITSMPGYEAGLEGVQRTMAAQGYQGSGNMAAAIQKYAGDFYNQQISQLSGLAGGTPGAGAPAMYEGLAGAANLQSSGLSALGRAFYPSPVLQ